jgi:hypothetical protein
MVRHSTVFAVCVHALCTLLLRGGAVAAADGTAPLSAIHTVAPNDSVEVLRLEPIFPDQLLAEDAAMAIASPGPQRFAAPTDVSMTPDDHGSWESVIGGQLWRIRVAAPNATDLNFGFTRFRLPVGATLHIMSEDHDSVQGPFTSIDNRDHGELWTPLVPGGRATIELYVPDDADFEPELAIGHIGRGYRDMARTAGDPGATKRQGDCNVDVACGAADGHAWIDGWRDEIQSVAVYTIEGYLKCTGTLIMDVPHSFEPFFLTAHHCGVTSSNDHTVVTYWNYQSEHCGDLGGGDLSQGVSGATLLAGRVDVDFSLLRLDEAPPPELAPYWSGWDRRADLIPDGAVCIHHPDAGEKAISLNDDPLTVTTSCISGGGPRDTHWEVDNWEVGTTEHGSSGAGLWNPGSHLLVGFLTGGMAACGNELWDCFGRFAVAWDGPSPGERLRDWLDPDGTGAHIVLGGKAIETLEQVREPSGRVPSDPEERGHRYD